MSQPRNTHSPAACANRRFTGTVALDIECINLVPSPDLDFTDPSHWSLFCAPVGYRGPAGEIETDVLFRSGTSLCDERELIDDLLEWIRTRHPARLLTYNGSSYDLPILRRRGAVTTRECRGHYSTYDDLTLVLDAFTHDDLFTTVKEQTGYNVPLESALAYHEIDTVETHLNGEEISGAHMPELGLKILSGVATNPEIQAVRQYAESDVEPLFELADAVLDD